uniref:Transmembrane protein n=1 Tax=Chromera velia CCMP2878 TaxID=1169474 RepID=A0A0G4GI32_9ALVE|mmetsp:Transcript_19345/g.39002  ORF Transcript_19345/g.39002 Transcript_19345/m.39002 type:complete len:116 (-) Transcript_19345:510-857(-)|eukprot:Cvel_21989.t1-p1 / transcript=Cvel_21989.t1 / gene=Cvel_21989 / organism=Chromera_velia_CCMP2878 / gene_product=hypothetical protein / transcript_product=hypothetical protein / location=Cvel_scaffold2118:4888-5232(-) / protein_length=115 / sequence_SO=supercontig / SO=protein_coding / is_pseudo=false
MFKALLATVAAFALGANAFVPSAPSMPRLKQSLLSKSSSSSTEAPVAAQLFAQQPSDFEKLYAEVMNMNVDDMEVRSEVSERPSIMALDFNRTSLFWGMLLMLVLGVLFSSYFFN